MSISIRVIEKKDNEPMAELIRTVFREFRIDKPGTVYTDPTTDDLYSLFQTEASVYWIAEENATILGGCGIFPTSGLPEGCAELVKFYLASTSRGKGIGNLLMQQSIASAITMGNKQLYIESFPEFNRAIGMYEKAGFMRLSKALGNSGHYACNIWMLKKLA